MTQADKDALFNQLKKDISETQPKLDNISKLLKQFVDRLCKFCPSKT